MYASFLNSGRSMSLTDRYRIALNKYFTKGSLTCLKKSVIQRRISADFPLMLNVEPTNACNSRCYYCPREINIKKHGIHFMDMDLYQSIIDQIKTNQLLMLNFHKDGEPLLHPKLPRIIDYAKKKQCAEILHLNTNGILLNTDIGRGIISAGIDDITVSVDAAREKSYRKIKRVSGLHKMEEGVRAIINYRNKIGASTVIRVKIMEFKDIEPSEIEEFKNRWEGIADQVQVTGIHNWGNAIEDLEVTDKKSDIRYPCPLLWYLLAINSNGLVSKCNYDWNYSGAIGDIRKQSIEEIWQGTAARSFRKAHLQGRWSKNQVCEGCVAWASFGDLTAILADREDFV